MRNAIKEHSFVSFWNNAVYELPFVKDFLEFNGKSNLIVAIYFSKWLELTQVSSKTAATVISEIKGIFVVHAVPRI
ncbi:hypothetical protein PR048_022195, partial [Dryococelus australis]